MEDVLWRMRAVIPPMQKVSLVVDNIKWGEEKLGSRRIQSDGRKKRVLKSKEAEVPKADKIIWI